MTIESKRKPRPEDRDRAERERERNRQEGVGHERMRQEEALDEALKNTFPASDPVSVEQPLLTVPPRTKSFLDIGG